MKNIIGFKPSINSNFFSMPKEDRFKAAPRIVILTGYSPNTDDWELGLLWGKEKELPEEGQRWYKSKFAINWWYTRPKLRIYLSRS